MQFCYQSKNMKSFLIALVFFSGICVNESWTTSVRQRKNGDQCPLWHIIIHNSNGVCECGATLSGVISCDKKFIYVDNGYCLTWNNLTNSEDLYRCLFTPWIFRHTSNRYSIPINMSGEELNYRMCSSFNRQGMQCGQCISGYGPAVFSDSVTCADCSKHKYLWILNLMFQLTMVTLMCLVFMIFQIKGTSSPLNIIIAYIQNIAFQYELSGLYYVQYFGQKVNAIFATILGIWNLNYFRFVLPPLCISSSLKAVDCVLFQYILAIYPLLFTGVAYFCIDHQGFVICYSPFKKYLSKVCKTMSWDPKTTILHTFATFFILSYTKLLFTSLCLLLVVHSYNDTGQRVSKSEVLLFDPSIRFLHSEHLPYASIALFVLLTCIIPPPILLVLHPSKFFKNVLAVLGFKDGMYFITSWMYSKDGSRTEQRVLLIIDFSLHFFSSYE